MPNSPSARSATARSFADGRLNRLPCAVREVLTRVQLEALYGAPVETITEAPGGRTAFLPG